MAVYLDLAVALNYLVDFLLLMGTDRLSGHPASPGRSALGALLGAVYAGACLIPGFSFLGSTLWRISFLGLMAWIAFGTGKSAIRRGILFILLSMALGGIAVGLGNGSFWAIAAGAGLVWALCKFGFRGKAGTEYVPIELSFGSKRKQILALRDTGNTLRDPVTGEPVLVVSSVIGEELLNLTEKQLRSPVKTVAAGVIPGLRLIPYRAVGQPAGMLPALRMDARINGKQKSTMVAFAPMALSREGEYQALTGGAL